MIDGNCALPTPHPMQARPFPAASAPPGRPDPRIQAAPGRWLAPWLCRAGLALFMLLAVLWPGAATHAQSGLTLEPGATHIALTERLDYVTDPARRWSPQQLPPEDAGWLPVREHAGGGNFGHVKHPVWFRIRIRSGLDRPSDWRWVVDHPVLSSINLVTVGEDGRPHNAGLAGVLPMARGEAPRQRVAAMPLQVAAHASVLVLMQIETEGVLRAPVHLYTEAAWGAHDRWLHMVLGSYFGLIAGLLAYNGVLWLRLRDASYGHYVGFGVGIGVYQLGSTGLGAVYAWPGWMAHSTLIMVVAAAWFAAFGLLFTDRFLRLREVAPRLSQVVRASALCWLPALAVLAFVPAGDFIRWVLLPLALWGVSLVLIAGVRGCWLKVPAAPIFLLGWSGLAVAGVMRAVLVQGWVSADSLPYHALLVATALEMVLLSFALADRISLERRARSQAEVTGASERAAREVAQRALQERTRFMAAVTHDLQQPLYALRMVAHNLVLQRGSAPDPGTLAQLQSAVHATNDLTASMMMAVQLHRDEVTPMLQTFHVQPMLDRIEALFSARARERHLRWGVTPSLQVLRTDPALLERMLSNLVSNALRYTHQGGVLLTCRQRQGQLLVQVWDTGPGIEPGEQAALFEPFRRGSAATPGDHGMGLGLSIVSRCASLLGIRLTLRSMPGRGTCFSLWVPCAQEVEGFP